MIYWFIMSEHTPEEFCWIVNEGIKTRTKESSDEFWVIFSFWIESGISQASDAMMDHLRFSHWTTQGINDLQDREGATL